MSGLPPETLTAAGRSGNELLAMRFQYSHSPRFLFFFSPEHGGSTVSGGGHPSADSPPASEAIDDAFAQDARGHGNTPGVGVPGSKSNPVLTHNGITERAQRIWEEEGRPDGKADEHWHRAEAELRNSARSGKNDS